MAIKLHSLLLFLLLLAFQELVMIRSGEAAICETPSKLFRGLCFRRDNCVTVCEKEGFLYGSCKTFKCICAKDCGSGIGAGGGDPGQGGGDPGQGGGEPGQGGGDPDQGGGDPSQGGGEPRQGGGDPGQDGGDPGQGGGDPGQGGGDGGEGPSSQGLYDGGH